MTTPKFADWRMFPKYSPAEHRKLTELFPPDPMEWARERARVAYTRCLSTRGWMPRADGLNDLGVAMSAAFRLELSRITGGRMPVGLAEDLAISFDVDVAAIAAELLAANENRSLAEGRA
mgnify:FL=1